MEYIIKVTWSSRSTTKYKVYGDNLASASCELLATLVQLNLDEATFYLGTPTKITAKRFKETNTPNSELPSL